jgi:hypothetical protein
MSDEIVRSKDGDMISFIPKDWFFVNVEDKASSEVFAVAVNPDYTLAAVFSMMRKSPELGEVCQKEGVIGLARMFMDKRQNKTAGAVTMLGSPSTVNMGPLNFGRYNFNASGGTSKGRAAVFISSIGQYYEFALIPMDFRGKPLPTQDEIETIFTSILATIQY